MEEAVSLALISLTQRLSCDVPIEPYIGVGFDGYRVRLVDPGVIGKGILEAEGYILPRWLYYEEYSRFDGQFVYITEEQKQNLPYNPPPDYVFNPLPMNTWDYIENEWLFSFECPAPWVFKESRIDRTFTRKLIQSILPFIKPSKRARPSPPPDEEKKKELQPFRMPSPQPPHLHDEDLQLGQSPPLHPPAAAPLVIPPSPQDTPAPQGLAALAMPDGPAQDASSHVSALDPPVRLFKLSIWTALLAFLIVYGCATVWYRRGSISRYIKRRYREMRLGCTALVSGQAGSSLFVQLFTKGGCTGTVARACSEFMAYLRGTAAASAVSPLVARLTKGFERFGRQVPSVLSEIEEPLGKPVNQKSHSNASTACELVEGSTGTLDEEREVGDQTEHCSVAAEGVSDTTQTEVLIEYGESGTVEAIHCADDEEQDGPPYMEDGHRELESKATEGEDLSVCEATLTTTGSHQEEVGCRRRHRKLSHIVSQMIEIQCGAARQRERSTVLNLTVRSPLGLSAAGGKPSKSVQTSGVRHVCASVQTPTNMLLAGIQSSGASALSNPSRTKQRPTGGSKWGPEYVSVGIDAVPPPQHQQSTPTELSPKQQQATSPKRNTGCSPKVAHSMPLLPPLPPAPPSSTHHHQAVGPSHEESLLLLPPAESWDSAPLIGKRIPSAFFYQELWLPSYLSTSSEDMSESPPPGIDIMPPPGFS